MWFLRLTNSCATPDSSARSTVCRRRHEVPEIPCTGFWFSSTKKEVRNDSWRAATFWTALSRLPRLMVPLITTHMVLFAVVWSSIRCFWNQNRDWPGDIGRILSKLGLDTSLESATETDVADETSCLSKSWSPK